MVGGQVKRTRRALPKCNPQKIKAVSSCRLLGNGHAGKSCRCVLSSCVTSQRPAKPHKGTSSSSFGWWCRTCPNAQTRELRDSIIIRCNPNNTHNHVSPSSQTHSSAPHAHDPRTDRQPSLPSECLRASPLFFYHTMLPPAFCRFSPAAARLFLLLEPNHPTIRIAVQLPAPSGFRQAQES